ncbi:hypothetical protein [Denitromonas ohlonensis]|uniref:DUF922 domain-containing protein n=2 Tax=Denitromonas TaxID=139331 RepID=A0A557R3Z8_9RHOO|nr:hypothetical protein [Denitromonas ohlonensis]TVO59854.1 hypothetical protein FHP90_19670 [Denitromonas ohlonensis]TVO72965.1 hypothetical protein FHP89_18400 [Denitromonas ohlonensis]
MLVRCATLAACLTALPASAASPDFAARCNALAAAANVRVVFEDHPVAYDNRHDTAALGRRSGAAASRNHSVLGVTHATPQSRLEVTARALVDTDGRVCAAPDITLHLGFSEMTVSLARELSTDCQRRVVGAHEQQHVAIWRNHYRAGARLIETRLRQGPPKPLYFASRQAMQRGLSVQIKARVAPWLARLDAGVGAAHASIDSPASYREVESRMRACP